jgi:hypothetical protein
MRAHGGEGGGHWQLGMAFRALTRREYQSKAPKPCHGYSGGGHPARAVAVAVAEAEVEVEAETKAGCRGPIRVL